MSEWSQEMEEWVKDIRNEEITRFNTQLERLEPLFYYAILSASILYGMGALRATELRETPSAAVLWLLFLTIGSITLILGFSFTLAYEYRWFDLVRIRLHLIHDFYDSQKAKGPPIKIRVPREEIEREYWFTDFPKDIAKTGDVGKIFENLTEGDITTFQVFNWFEALRRLKTNEKPIMSTWIAFGRQFIKGRRDLILFTLVILTPLLCFTLGAVEANATAVLVIIIILIYLVVHDLVECYAPIARGR